MYKRAPFSKIGRERAKRAAETRTRSVARMLKKRNFQEFGDFKKKKKAEKGSYNNSSSPSARPAKTMVSSTSVAKCVVKTTRL